MKIYEINNESIEAFEKRLASRSLTAVTEYETRVAAILKDVNERGDEAVFDYTAKFDKWAVSKENFKVSEAEIKDAYKQVPDRFVEIVRKAIANIESYHKKQLKNTWLDTKEDGSILGMKYTALESVGVYVPGGKAAYPSSVLMNVIPAKVAGVKRIVMTTPAGADGKVYAATLVAAKEAGVTDIFKAGGAQAIAALAYGTESIKKVDKIVGPGNVYVALAKKLVYGRVGIDSVAGPSEILVLADKTADYRFVAADLLSQAEHDEMASAILVTTDRELGEKVSVEIDRLCGVLERSAIIKKSVEDYGAVFIAKDLDEAIMMVNRIASEHLEVITENAFNVMPKIQNAGAIFLGPWSSEPLGDYFAGPNHVLPTSGTARFFSPLGVDDFVKRSSIIAYTETGLKAVYRDVVEFANFEGLTAHANSIAVRFGEGK